MHFLPYVTLAESIFAALVCSCSTVVQCDHVKPTAWCEFGCPRSCVHGVHPDALPFSIRQRSTRTYHTCNVKQSVSECLNKWWHHCTFQRKKCQGGWRSHAGCSARRDELFCPNIIKMSAKLGAKGFVCHCNKGYLTHWIKKERAQDKTSVCDELEWKCVDKPGIRSCRQCSIVIKTGQQL